MGERRMKGRKKGKKKENGNISKAGRENNGI
jgi:hypothetical protein